MAKGLFAKVPVILSSATMSSTTKESKTFDFFAGRIGVKEYNSLIVDSPFDYEKKTMIFCPDDTPDPNRPEYLQYVPNKIEDSMLGMTNLSISLPVVAVAAVSALLPDIDEPNSLLVSKTIPKDLIRLLKALMIGIGLLSGSAFAPWNTVIAILAASIFFMPIRTFRNVIMILTGAALILFGHSLIPWNYIIGCLLIICALVPHRGLTHTFYGVTGWTLLLFFNPYLC
ncbi:metal-dependent hydrolase [Paenibacillus sp. 19GGS1-52]|uniref:metal-dependent hydrolase n=1 Tax=Paenibacillus sp. 19GGS1-52 TaxID=2758563 RepID=UPI001EFAD403|nr:metal-dependent hydrolase [Paenibacillus sp. 19GGS1-52]